MSHNLDLHIGVYVPRNPIKNQSYLKIRGVYLVEKHSYRKIAFLVYYPGFAIPSLYDKLSKILYRCETAREFIRKARNARFLVRRFPLLRKYQ